MIKEKKRVHLAKVEKVKPPAMIVSPFRHGITNMKQHFANAGWDSPSDRRKQILIEKRSKHDGSPENPRQIQMIMYSFCYFPTFKSSL